MLISVATTRGGWVKAKEKNGNRPWRHPNRSSKNSGAGFISPEQQRANNAKAAKDKNESAIKGLNNKRKG